METPTIVEKICKQKNITVQEIKESSNNLIRGNEMLIIKQYIHQKNFEHELAILQKLSGLNKLYFPQIIEYYQEEKIIIMSRLPGKDLDKIRNKIPQSNKETILTQLATILKEIHSIKSDSGYDFIDYYKDHYISLFDLAKNNPHIKSTEIEAIHQNILSTFSSRKGEESILLHHDFWVKNIFSDGQNVTGIIDFESGFYGPLAIEGLKIRRDRMMINMPGCDDTSSDEIAFMDEFIVCLEKVYPELFVFNKQQYYNYCGVEYFYKLSRYKESWYDHKEVEYAKEKMEFLDILS